MSGPIVRKYGFANFEKIFGERELKHGIEGEPTTAPASQTSVETPMPAKMTEPKKAEADPSKP